MITQYFVSAHLNGLTHGENERRHHLLRDHFNKMGLSTSSVEGCYKGETEQSLMLCFSGEISQRIHATILSAAMDCGQESILIVKGDDAYLVTLSNLSSVSLGTFKEVSEEEALEQDGYTKIGTEYWVAS